ncbi:hypothetical protein CONPUDRAFT_159095 [Coniophora puteana RWD-64-598 SS2]|uniref:Uncharacterized protein n=1 Tax=Coniophora puteana (strain RWD-64-598) TaxID=741705 RepID=A0A5M3M8Q7_CONPW|nr:uncharacterized protein CONPUDRAFT_159095 [Coniophora puteana RWD-64-598 SS2]EIW75652.1 hypothetical protein CONPUDRAFT_159095 [Coniophora puteana RWD-64-598 SS2]
MSDPAGEDYRDAMRDIESSTSDEDKSDEDEANGDGDAADNRAQETTDETLAQARVMATDADNATVPQLRSGLKFAQAQCTKSHSTILELRRRIQELEEELAQATSKRKPTTIESKVIEVGRQFVYLFRLIPPNYLFPLRGVEPLDPRHPSRFKDIEKRRRCLVTEFVKFLSPELRKAVANYPNFQEKFLQGARSEIGIFVNSVKSQCPHIYAGLNIGSLGLSTAENLPKDPVVKWLLEDPFASDDSEERASNEGDKEEEEEEEVDAVPTFPRILFQDPSLPDGEELFRATALINAAKAALFGPSSLNGRGGSGGPRPRAVRWSMKGVTPGLICALAILVIHRLTMDNDFNSTGKVTHVNWDARFDEYLAVLNRNLEWTDKLLAYWDAILFPKSGSTKKAGRAAPRDPIDRANSLFDKLQARTMSAEPEPSGAPANSDSASAALKIQQQIGQLSITDSTAPVDTAPAVSSARARSVRASPVPSTSLAQQPSSSASAASLEIIPADVPTQADVLATKPARRTRQTARSTQDGDQESSSKAKRSAGGAKRNKAT